ncbi:NAD(P)-dependent alcohol dehydrogenase [Stappia sp. 28M-7]|uniref:zinc-dependent alcohol dehydrogenase family protein n=1 Tax=Stappia sp. 28M-7 TaxID=2762596 RepID=UPI00163CB953|nr:NAD(P)-dependent alcohol dehydrogenase [Stappia sp. 28M-7]MBC2860528.1 NAD(P)-dependent alcohol dehydrogenase [Stappia sp. 28M-7]
MRVFEIRDDWGLDNLRPGQREVPRAGRGQVLLKMRRAALNARDLIVPERGYGRATGELPLIPLSDGVGEVVEVGADVTRVALGDRVCPTFFQNWVAGSPSAAAFASALGGPLDGVMAEYVCLSEEGVVKVPKYLDDAEAASLPCAALTAWSAVSGEARLRPGDHVLLQGTGGVALFALQFAKLHGATVTVLSSSDEKLARVAEMGADHLVNYREHADWARATRALVAERGGYDAIVELGGAQTLGQSLRAIRPGGTIAMIGVLSGLDLSMSLGPIVTRQIRLQGVTVGHRDDFEAMLRAMAAHQVRPLVGSSFPFEGLKEAMAHFAQADRFGKTVIEF